MLCVNISHIAIITVQGVEYLFNVRDISKSEAIQLLENSALEDSGYI